MTMSEEGLVIARRTAPVVLLAFFWAWETWRPFFGQPEGRLRHAGRNLTLALLNVAMVGLLFGAATASLACWAGQKQLGLLRLVELAGPTRLALAMVLLDGWMYLWHRANHAVPLLWRFHRMHHSDRRMDVTTA